MLLVCRVPLKKQKQKKTKQENNNAALFYIPQHTQRDSNTHESKLQPLPDTTYRLDYGWQCVEHADHVQYKSVNTANPASIFKEKGGQPFQVAAVDQNLLQSLRWKLRETKWSIIKHRSTQISTDTLILYTICQPCPTLDLFAHNFCQNIISSSEHVSPLPRGETSKRRSSVTHYIKRRFKNVKLEKELTWHRV